MGRPAQRPDELYNLLLAAAAKRPRLIVLSDDDWWYYHDVILTKEIRDLYEKQGYFTISREGAILSYRRVPGTLREPYLTTFKAIPVAKRSDLARIRNRRADGLDGLLIVDIET